MPPSILDVLTKTVTIPAGQTESTTLDLESYTLAAVYMPAVFSGTSLSIKAAPTPDGTFLPLHTDATGGAAVSIVVAANRCVGIDSSAGALAALRYIRFVSSASEAADRTLTLLLKQA